jgi:toxin ParE1/3/4
MTIRFSARAREQLIAIQEYVSERNPAAATHIGEQIRQSTELLDHFPFAGRAGRSEGTREWVVRGLPYVIVYQVDSRDPVQVTILGVFHCAQRR